MCVYDLCLYDLNLYNGMCLCTMNKCSLTNKTPHLNTNNALPTCTCTCQKHAQSETLCTHNNTNYM